MKKNYIITILVACLMATSFVSAEAEENPNSLLLNANHFGKNPNYGANAVFSQYDEASSVMAPKRRKSKRRKGGRRGRGSNTETVRFGLDAGVNMTTISIEGASNKMGLGFTVGGYLDYNISEVVFIEGGVYLISKKATSEIAVSQSIPMMMSVAIVSKSDYNPMFLTIPITFGFNLVNTDAFKFNFKVGPYIGLGLTGKLKNETKGNMTTYDFDDNPVVMDINSETEEDVFSVMKKTDFGIRGGVGFDISNFNIGLFVDYGLTKVAAGSTTSTVTIGQTTTTQEMEYTGNIMTIGFNLGYKF